MTGVPQVGIDGRGRLTAINVFPWREAIADLAGVRFTKRTATHPAYWTLPATAGSAAALLGVLADSGAQISPRVLALAQEAGTREERRALAADESTVPELPWHEWLKTTPRPYQKRGIVYLRDASAAALGMGMGPQPTGTPILTPKGWRTLGDLAPGDEVFGSSGRPATVVATYSQGTRLVYRVTFSDNTETYATGDHLWLMRSAHQRCRNQPGRVVRTVDMLATGLHNPKSRNAARYFLPDAPQVDIDLTAELPIPPYSLGVLLGDGGLGHGVTVTTPDTSILERLERETANAFGTRWAWMRPPDKCQYIRAYLGPLHEELKRFGLTGRSETKVIPQSYLLAGPTQRWDLLRGLLDTDGSGSGNCRVEFSSASPELAAQTAWLARSVGAVVREAGPSSAGYRTAEGRFVACLPRHRVAIAFASDAPDPFTVTRKIDDYRAGSERMQRRRPPRSVKSIVPVGETTVCCIELDRSQAPDSVYLTDVDLIPTHNTGKSLVVVAALNLLELDKALVVCPVATLGVFPRELRLHSTREWHTENGVRRTLKGTLKVLSLVDRWNLITDLYACRCGKPHAAVIGYHALIRDPMASADLAALGVQVIVYDEAHALKSAGGVMSKTAYSWVNQVPRRWGLSGTLMPQSPDDIYGTYRALDPAIFGTNKTEFRARYIVMGTTRDGREFPKDVLRSERLEFSRRFHSIAFVPIVDLKLPRSTHTIRSFELESAARRVYEDIKEIGLAEISAAVVAAGGSPTPAEDERTVAPANAGVELLRFAQITGGAVKDDEGVVSVISHAKVTALAEVLHEVGCRMGGHDGRSRPEPVVVFCRFRADLDAVAQLCRSKGLRYAEISGRTKDGLDDEAKMNPDCDVVAAQIASGSQGIDLTRARINVWYSIGFELWLFQQAQKRSDRPGQTRSVANFYLIAEETIDGAIYAALARKESVIDSCVDAYLRHVAERPSEELPQMDPGAGEVAGEMPVLPEWLLGGQAPRPVPDREREEEHAVLALGGLSGF